MSKVLLVDDDDGLLLTTRSILQLAGHDVATERRGTVAVRTAMDAPPDVMLIDLCLSDCCGLDVLVELRPNLPLTRFVLMTGFGDLQTVIEAIRFGASDYLEKPFFSEELLATVARVCGRERSLGADPDPVSHDLERWADAVIKFVPAAKDVLTLSAFGRVVGTSAGAFRSWCRTARLSPRASLQFARGLRVVTHRELDPSRTVESLLNIVDARTLSKFSIASGGTTNALPATTDEFLRYQTFVNQDAVGAIRRVLMSPGGGSAATRWNDSVAVGSACDASFV